MALIKTGRIIFKRMRGRIIPIHVKLPELDVIHYKWVLKMAKKGKEFKPGVVSDAAKRLGVKIPKTISNKEFDKIRKIISSRKIK